MKRCFIIIFIFLTASGSFSQFVQFDWARSLDRATGFSGDETYLIGVDALKNVYVGGNFRNTMDLDPGAGVSNVHSQWDNMFICKLDSFGNFTWGKQMGGNRFTIIKSLYVDSAGNIYTTGRFSGTADFDPGPATFNLTADYPTNPECNGIFISKLDKDGQFKWAKQIGGNAPEYTGFGITVDRFGHVYTTGYIVGVTDMDPGSGTDNQGTNGVVNVFVEKLDNNGNFIFGKVFYGNHDADGQYIRTDYNGNIYTSGNFGGTVDFDPGPGTFNITVPLYSFTPFICKLDPSGNFIWAKQDMGNCPFAVDQFQNIITYSGNSPGVLKKYDINGNPLWTKITGGSPYITYQSATIQLDAANNIFITGMFRDTRDFDPGPGVYNMTVHSGGFNSDVFVNRLDPDGNFVWAVSFGSFYEDYAHSLALDRSGNIYTSGVYISTTDFDPGPGVYTLTPGIAGGGIFIHKLAPCTNTSSSLLNISACNSYTLNNITYTTSGTFIQTLPNAAGCDSIITLNLILGGTNTNLSVTACDSYTWNGQTYTTSGIYRDTLSSANGCDSILNLDLTIKNKSASLINASICEGLSYSGYTLTGTYTDTFVAANGCDSVRTLMLDVKPRKYTTLSAAICQGQSYLGYSTTGIHTDTFAAANGCDSIRIVNLAVNPVYRSTVHKFICEGQQYLGYTATGTYVHSLLSVSGCDSIIDLHLTVEKIPRPYIGVDTFICSGQTLTLSPGIFQSYLWQDASALDHYTVKHGGTYSVTVTNACGTGFATLHVLEPACKWSFPDVFTPNNDGVNDVFKIINGYNLTNYTLAIYNRYGQKVFETGNYLHGWDGNYLNKPSVPGAYVWYCTFKESDVLRSVKGSVILLK